ncbi:hypothetical protein Pmar_PMAR007558 [Perkinsus marinus ATCC 50983]|uniref:Uncharacterized protein n=1 Tax=Perkinsus marinus (strain ATCC 50983 / TXsc) TaxID=423536 RepID=C5LKC3_PERM5|nr:hypothetical protein Pmar_PMAR007558 [Perkinsus marinus ATCC 50983]EER02805.1 hypothetical protein Pmar_PMAR007558 [Perkinsus marinus ATCC 50983]|eukprot:XP_002770989.1 hypothetical protein Pmar_PMAR007558 [Perkinsus marinus ATCC 50983]
MFKCFTQSSRKPLLTEQARTRALPLADSGNARGGDSKEAETTDDDREALVNIGVLEVK